MRLGCRVLAVMVVFVLASAVVPPAHGLTSSQADAQIASAYSAVLAAEQSGGNVTSLVGQLNSAISLVQQANSIEIVKKGSEK